MPTTDELIARAAGIVERLRTMDPKSPEFMDFAFKLLEVTHELLGMNDD